MATSPQPPTGPLAWQQHDQDKYSLYSLFYYIKAADRFADLSYIIAEKLARNIP